MQPTETPEDRAMAWLGDAALAIVAREWILETHGGLDGEVHQRLTSNHFLRCFGHPTKVEAELGMLYREGGVEAVRKRFFSVMVPKYRDVYETGEAELGRRR